jgi:hypothetical protein
MADNFSVYYRKKTKTINDMNEKKGSERNRKPKSYCYIQFRNQE